MMYFNQTNKVVLDELLEGNPLVRPGKMFGYPAFYVGKKLSICLYEDGVGVKLPEKTVEKMLDSDPNTIPFQPLGKPKMREWIQINLENSQDYRDYLPIFEQSIRFLLDMQHKTTSK